MGKVIKFTQEQEEQHSCSVCDLVHEFVSYAKDCESEEELFDVLSDLAQESIKLGVVNYLQQEITHKAELVDRLIYGDECCDCDECCCEDFCDCEDED